MVNREETVTKMKAQLDQFSAQMAAWESTARGAKSEAKSELRKQIGILRSRIDDMAFRMELLKGASADAWQEVARGAEEARKAMQVSFERARAKFDGI
jgi:hypothetical protein